jgi:hypothetical protein
LLLTVWFGSPLFIKETEKAGAGVTPWVRGQPKGLQRQKKKYKIKKG